MLAACAARLCAAGVRQRSGLTWQHSACNACSACETAAVTVRGGNIGAPFSRAREAGECHLLELRAPRGEGPPVGAQRRPDAGVARSLTGAPPARTVEAPAPGGGENRLVPRHGGSVAWADGRCGAAARRPRTVLARPGGRERPACTGAGAPRQRARGSLSRPCCSDGCWAAERTAAAATSAVMPTASSRPEVQRAAGTGVGARRERHACGRSASAQPSARRWPSQLRLGKGGREQRRTACRTARAFAGERARAARAPLQRRRPRGPRPRGL